jgi:hypothetical protein
LQKPHVLQVDDVDLAGDRKSVFGHFNGALRPYSVLEPIARSIGLKAGDDRNWQAMQDSLPLRDGKAVDIMLA